MASRRTRAQRMSDMIAELTGNGEEMICCAIEMMRDKEAPWQQRADARDYLSDRCAGKATTVVETETKVTVGIAGRYDPRRLTDEQLALQESLVRMALGPAREDVIDIEPEPEEPSRVSLKAVASMRDGS